MSVSLTKYKTPCHQLNQILRPVFVSNTNFEVTLCMQVRLEEEFKYLYDYVDGIGDTMINENQLSSFEFQRILYTHEMQFNTKIRAQQCSELFLWRYEYFKIPRVFVLSFFGQ